MKNDNKQALIDLVRSLGYEKPETLSNWVRDILKDKEDFARQYVVEAKSEFGGRPEKFLVNSKAKILVDNLCLLKPYLSLFEKSTNDEKALSVYRHLKKGDYKTKFDVKYLRLQKKLRVTKLINDTAIENLSPFSKVLTAQANIDITSQSLRALMQSEVNSNDVIDFSRSIDIAAWNDLSDLKEQLLEGGEGNSTLYCQVGERLMELGEQGEALIALKKATECDEFNGIAWALQAKLYLELLSKSNQEQMEALSHTDFSGFIDNPIDAEERWINERIEDTHDNSASLRKKFIAASVLALLNWPCWEYDGCTKAKRNFQLNLKIAHDCNVDMNRDWLFAYLVITLEHADFDDQLKLDFLVILNDFQHNDPQTYPLPSLMGLFWLRERQLSLRYEIDLVDILYGFYPERADLALSSLIKKMREWGHSADEHLAILSGSKIRQIIWERLGQAEFTKLYSICEQHRFEQQEKERISTRCELQLSSVLRSFSKLGLQLMHCAYLEFSRHSLLESFLGRKESFSEDEIETEFKTALINGKSDIVGWGELLNESLWQKEAFALDLPNGMLPLIFMSALIELCLGDERIDCLDIILEFVENRYALKSVIGTVSDKMPYGDTGMHLIKYLLGSVKGRRNGVLLSIKLAPVRELVCELRQIIDFEMEDGRGWNLDEVEVDGLAELLEEKDSLTIKS